MLGLGKCCSPGSDGLGAEARPWTVPASNSAGTSSSRIALGSVRHRPYGAGPLWHGWELDSAALGLAVAWGYLVQVPCPGSATLAASVAAAPPALP